MRADPPPGRAAPAHLAARRQTPEQDTLAMPRGRHARAGRGPEGGAP